MTTLDAIYTSMKRYNNTVAFGSECNAWQDFVADCFSQLGFAPWADEHWPNEMPEDFAAYWLDVSSSNSRDYDAETGARITD